MPTTSSGVSSTCYPPDDDPCGVLAQELLGANDSTRPVRRERAAANSVLSRAQHAKGIFEQGRWNSIDLLRAPFGSRADTLLKFFLQ